MPAAGSPFCGRAVPDMAAWYSASNSGRPEPARKRIRGPLLIRTYQERFRAG